MSATGGSGRPTALGSMPVSTRNGKAVLKPGPISCATFKQCPGCRELFLRADLPGLGQCRPCINAYARSWRATNHGSDAQRERQRKRRLRDKGITPEIEADILARQGGACAVCGSSDPGQQRRWHIDHDHACCPGQIACGSCVRGLLCLTCNTGLGSFADDPGRLRRAAQYLEESRAS